MANRKASKAPKQARPSDAAPAPAALIAHEIPGRLRARLTGALERAALTALADRIAATPGVRRVTVRPNTGSVIVESDPALGPIAAKLTAGGVLRLKPEPTPPPVEQAAQFGLMRLDAEVARRTEGAFNFHSALATLLMLGALVQIARGNVAGPATTLAMSALSLLERSR